MKSIDKNNETTKVAKCMLLALICLCLKRFSNGLNKKDNVIGDCIVKSRP